MKQKGFIQITLLVAVAMAVVGVASMGVGIVFYKQQKAPAFMASISNAIYKNFYEKEFELEKIKQEAEFTKVKQQQAESAKSKAEVEELKNELASVKRITEVMQQEAAITPYISDVIPRQVFNNVTSILIIKGGNFKNGLEVMVGDRKIQDITLLGENTINVKVLPGLAGKSHDVQVLNPNGKIGTLQNALVVVNVPAQLPTPELTTLDIVNKVSPSVILIYNSVKSGTGSGVIIDSTGLALTNEHVIDGDSIIDVILNDGSITSAQVVGWNKLYDLAIIKLDGISFDSASLAGSSYTDLGSDVIAFGYPKASILGIQTVTITKGILSAKRTFDGVSYFQTDAAINSGNSGGPLVNTKGKVVGINTSILTGSQNIGFAIDVNAAESIISDIKSGAKE